MPARNALTATARIRAALVFFSWLLGRAACTLHSLQQDAPRPGLALTDRPQTPIAWWEGGPAFTLASAGAVRINFRGIIAYPPSARVRNLSATSGWHSTPCNASAWALCSSDVGQVLAPTPPRMPERRSLVQVDGWADLACEDSAAKLLTNKGVYDVSACDILDHGLDLVYYHPSKVAHRHSETPLWKYWTMVILAIVLVRCLSYNVQGLWEAGHSDAAASEGGGAGTMTRGKEQWPALLASLVLLILVLIDGDAAYVTTADQLFFWSTAAYILAYLAIHGWAQFKKRIQSPESQGIEDMEQMEEQDEGGADDESPERAQERYERPVYNIIVATLQLVVMHFYSSAETPYNIVLLGMLACRGW